MKIHRLLEDYLHWQIRKSSGDWDDVANVPDITDTLSNDNKNPFDKDYWQSKISENRGTEKFEKNYKNKKFDFVI